MARTSRRGWHSSRAPSSLMPSAGTAAPVSNLHPASSVNTASVSGGIVLNPVDGFADLHLVHPPLGQVLRDVEPDRNRVVAGPADAAGTQQVHGRVVGIHLSAGPLEHIGENPRTQTLSAFDPPLILRRQGNHQACVVRHDEQTASITISAAGKPSEVIVK